MRAIVDINGKQYEVEEGRYVTVDKYPAEENDSVLLENIRLILTGEDTLIGAPFVDGATVKTTVRRHGRGPKVLVYKMRCKKGYRRKNGHRQDFTELLVSLVDFPGRDKLAPAKAYEAAPAREPKAPKGKAAVEAPIKKAKPAPQAEAVKEEKAMTVDTPAKDEKPKAKKGSAKTAKADDSQETKVQAPESATPVTEATPEAPENQQAPPVQQTVEASTSEEAPSSPQPEAGETPQPEVE